MKKFTLFLVAITMSLFSFAAQPKRIYAYDLSSTLVDKVYTFSFTANETPTSGKIIFYDATSSELVGEIALTNPVLGKNEVEIAEYSLPGNDGQQLNWSVELSAAEVTAFEAVYTGAKKYGRGHAAIDNSPESNYFGRVYVTDRRKTDSNGGLYVYTPSLQLVGNDVYKLGRSRNGYSRPAVAADGTLFLADYTDAERSGIYVVDPSDLTTCTQFYDGTRASNGLFTNTNGEEIGSSTSGVGVFGSGANMVLYTMMEDGSNPSAAVSYHIGQPDGSILKSWSNVPTWICKGFASINVSTNNAFAATEKGVWISQNDAVAVGSRTELVFIDKNGTLQFQQDKQMCKGAGLAVNADNSKLYISGSNNIVEYNITWNGNKPTLELSETHSISYAQVSTLSLDYAGNLIACVGASYGSTDSNIMLLVQYTLPTTNNTCEVPAKKADVVTKVEAAVTLYTITTNVNDPIMGSVSGNLGTYEAGAPAELTAVANEHYDFVNWTVGESVVSEEATYSFDVTENVTITANFEKKSYTLTVNVNDGTKGSVNITSGTYEAEEEVEITATANTNYEFAGWSNGSKENPLTITMEENTELTANFRAILPTSITLYAHPTKDYSTSIVGTMKRAIQNGENTIVLTHEDNGTPHIYNIAHATKEVTEISQVGVVAVDPDNAGDFLAISDIALTDDGKLVACNYMMCQITANEVDAGYKRGTSRFYIWDNLGGDPRLWISSQLTGNYYRASMGYTMALKGTSMNAEVTISAFNKTNANTRYSHLYVVDGAYSDANYKYSRDNAALHPNTLGKNTYELNASPLAAGKWIVDGELASPIEFVEKDAVAIDTYTALNTNVLGKKYNGASYLFHKDHHLMIAPYAADDKLAGVKVLGITDGFGSAVEVTTSTNLVSAVNAVAAAATAYVDGDGDLTIYLIADGKVYTFSEKVYTAQTFTVTATAGEGGSVEGGGTYEEGATAKLTATANKHYDFVNWTGDVTSTENPLMITVNSALTVTANFQEHDKFTINAHADHTSKGYVTGGGTDIYVGTELVLKATAKTGYYFTQWQDGNTDNPRTISVTEAAEYIAEFAEAYPRVYAYNLNVVSNGDDTYTFSFKPNTDATSGNLILYNEDGTTVAKTVAITMPIVANTVNSITLLKTELPDQPVIPWAIELIGNAIPAFAEIFADTDYRFARAHAVIDNSPESEYFGRVYVADRRQTKQNSKVYVYNPDFTDLTATNLGLATAGYSRPAVGADGTLYLTGYTDGAEAGIFVVDPADLTKCTQFFNGTYDSDGLYKNNGKEIGSSTSGVGVYGEGKDAVLYTMMEDGSNANFDRGKQPIVCYQIGQENGTVLKQWSDEPTWLVNYPATGYDTYNYGNNDFSATAKGVWVSQNKSNPADRPEIAFVDKTGTIQFMQNSKPSLGGGMTVNADNTALYIVEDSKILEYAITWNENTPSLTLSNTYPISLQYISTLSVDYAGNLIACAGTTYKTTDNNVMKLVAFTLPTDNNTCIVPAAKAKALKLGTIYNIEVAVNDPAMGSATGGGEYVEGETATLEASPAAHHKFVNWTYGSETSTNNPLELVVEENITVTANFEPVQYTLITPTNDENKGTVSVDGVCTHGSTVTLTATAKPGYKLLYWSDRSTENPRTITMTKNEAISAYFVKDYAEEPTFKIEKMWENTKVPASTGNGFQAVGWDGKIYMQNKAAGKIQVFSNETDAPVDYATSGIGQKIAVDEAGNMIVCNSTFAAATNNKVLIYLKGSTEGKEVSFTLLQDGRCDFFSASGNIYSAEGGYVYFYCQSTTVVNRVKIANGELVSVDVVGNNITAGNSQNHVMVDIFGNLVAHSRSAVINATINVHTNESMPFALIDHKYGTLGGCSFELGGKELWAYHAGATNYSSEWNIYNMTDSKFLSDDDFYAVDKDNSTNNAANWLNVQVVDENTAYIYQFCPKKAVAMWKVSINRTDLQEFTVTATANDPTMGTVTGGDTYYEEATATLIATPNAGYRFVNWTKAGVEVSTDATYTFTVTEDVELVANFAPLPEITYELNGGVWNTYGWTSKKDMYDAFIADWKAYSGSTRGTIPYEDQFGIGKSNAGIPTTIQESEPIMEFMTQDKWEWLGQFLDALAIAQGKETMPTTAVKQMRFGLGNFFGEDNNQTGWVGAVDCSGDKASLSAFAPYWGQTFPMPTQPTEEVVLNAPYREGYEFDGWYTTYDFSGAAVTTVDENTDGTLYAKWIETIITVTIGEDVDNTTNLAPYVDKTVTVTVTRHFGVNKILTVTLPFDMNASQISTHFGNATVYEFYNVVDAGEELHLQFSRTTSIEAGKPYIIQTAASGYDAEDGFTIEGVTVTTELTPIELSGITMVPVLDGGDRLENANEYFLSNSALYCAGDYPRDLQGLRAYFTSNSSKTLRARVVFDDNEETSLPTITNPNNNVQKIVKNGQLIIIRGENQYNAQGQTISIE